MSPTNGPATGLRERLNSSVALGLALIGMGILLLLDRMQILDAGVLATDWWPLMVVAVGAWMVLTSSRLAGALLALVGLLLLGSIHDVVEADLVGLIWPTLLLVVGVGGLVAGARMRGVTRVQPRTLAAETGRAIPTATAVFGDARMTLNDDGSGRTALTALSVFGDVLVSVPPGWRVIDRTSTLFGDIKIPRDQPSYAEAPVLEVHGMALFGDTRVRYLDETGSL